MLQRMCDEVLLLFGQFLFKVDEPVMIDIILPGVLIFGVLLFKYLNVLDSRPV